MNHSSVFCVFGFVGFYLECFILLCAYSFLFIPFLWMFHFRLSVSHLSSLSVASSIGISPLLFHGTIKWKWIHKSVVSRWHTHKDVLHDKLHHTHLCVSLSPYLSCFWIFNENEKIDSSDCIYEDQQHWNVTLETLLPLSKDSSLSFRFVTVFACIPFCNGKSRVGCLMQMHELGMTPIPVKRLFFHTSDEL